MIVSRWDKQTKPAMILSGKTHKLRRCNEEWDEPFIGIILKDQLNSCAHRRASHPDSVSSYRWNVNYPLQYVKYQHSHQLQLYDDVNYGTLGNDSSRAINARIIIAKTAPPAIAVLPNSKHPRIPGSQHSPLHFWVPLQLYPPDGGSRPRWVARGLMGHGFDRRLAAGNRLNGTAHLTWKKRLIVILIQGISTDTPYRSIQSKSHVNSQPSHGPHVRSSLSKCFNRHPSRTTTTRASTADVLSHQNFTNRPRTLKTIDLRDPIKSAFFSSRRATCQHTRR